MKFLKDCVKRLEHQKDEWCKLSLNLELSVCCTFVVIRWHLGSISSTYLPADHKSAKRHSSHQCLFTLLGPACAKAAHKTLVKSTPDFLRNGKRHHLTFQISDKLKFELLPLLQILSKDLITIITTTLEKGSRESHCKKNVV